MIELIVTDIIMTAFKEYQSYSSLLIESELASKIRLIPFSNFRKLQRTPRLPDDLEFIITLKQLDEAEYESSLIVFVSHSWLRAWEGAAGWDGKPHPDNLSQDKYQLCVEGIDEILRTLAPGMKNCYLWIDYGCIDQNQMNPGEELFGNFDFIMGICDCIFTPLFDPNHENWDLVPTNAGFFEDYKAENWSAHDHSYLNRAWCRLEMYYGANLPVLLDSDERKQKFQKGLAYHRRLGRRPHFLYGSKEAVSSNRKLARLVPPLIHHYLERYHPEKGKLTSSYDFAIIQRLVNDLKPYIKEIKPGYEGEMKDGKRHGQGKMFFARGDVFEGNYENDIINGFGRYTCTDGGVYEGEWKANMRNGFGTFLLPTGGVYEGEWLNNLTHGYGIYSYPNGDIYEGHWKENKREGFGKFEEKESGDHYEGTWYQGRKEGKGKMVYGNGEIYDGDWKNDQFDGIGKYFYIDGKIIEGMWKENIFIGDGKVMI